LRQRFEDDLFDRQIDRTDRQVTAQMTDTPPDSAPAAKGSNRIPAARSHQFTNWNLPEIRDGEPVAVAAERQRREAEAQVVARPVTARELEEITNTAYREGFDQGYGDGRREGLAAGREAGQAEARTAAQTALQQQLAQLRAVMAQLQEPLAGQQEAIEAALTRLALDIARTVLGREPALPPERLLPVVREAVKQLPAGERNLTVVLHPEQLALVREYADWPEHWRLEADARVAPGGCQVVTEHSLVDYTVNLRFRQVAERLLAEHADSEPPEPGVLLDHHDDDTLP
jgi:flagellar assembly protein FliH